MGMNSVMTKTRLTWLGHGSWLIEADANDEQGSTRIVLDPFLTENPSAKVNADQLGKVSHVLVSHAHFDHIADVARIAKASDATLIANFEIVQWFQKHHGIANAVMMNTGGRTALPCGDVLLTPALHSSSFPDGSYGGCPGGFVLTSGGKRIYFACDTAFFSDMRHYAHGVDLAVLPIGDLFTMGVEESLAAIKVIEPKRVMAAHFGTWPPIAQDINHWAYRVKNETNADPVVVNVGEVWHV
jgi:L-ascorbate metabolism protein UlaG (beta-lactamase superfamily)